MAVQPAVLTQAAATTQPRSHRGGLTRVARVLVTLDTLALLLTGTLTVLLTHGDTPWVLAFTVMFATVTAWVITLAVTGAYDTRILGVGTEEFTRVLVSGIIIAALTATAAFLTAAQDLRGMFIVGVPLGLVVVLTLHRVVRAWIHAQRRNGRLSARTLVLGTAERCQDITDQVSADTSVGLTLVGTHLPPTGAHEPWLTDVLQRVQRDNIEAVIVTPSTYLGPDVVRHLAWGLAESDVDLLVAPALTEVSGPRVSMRKAPRLPLVHLDEPQLTGPQQALKRTGDAIVAGIGLIVLAPVMLLIAALVRLSRTGPVLFHQQRIGRDGQPIVIAKFRTMTPGAERHHDDILGAPTGRDLAVLKHDPRITRLGRVLRRWSLDELPQLWSVVRGDMSLVGPRPLLASEAAWLEPHGHRRHLMRPGLTGLWQVSGRKEVDWAERIRLDVDYVDNWSPALDILLLLRTVKAVITGDGAH